MAAPCAYRAEDPVWLSHQNPQPFPPSRTVINQEQSCCLHWSVERVVVIGSLRYYGSSDHWKQEGWSTWPSLEITPVFSASAGRTVLLGSRTILGKVWRKCKPTRSRKRANISFQLCTFPEAVLLPELHLEGRSGLRSWGLLCSCTHLYGISQELHITNTRRLLYWGMLVSPRVSWLVNSEISFQIYYYFFKLCFVFFCFFPDRVFLLSLGYLGTLSVD